MILLTVLLEGNSVRALDIITAKRDGESLSREQTQFLIDGYVSGSIPEYQISAWLMATYFSGMTMQETADLTQCMIDSGRTIDLSGLPGPLVDKHSTGGVGDKVSLVLAPLAAAHGIQVPMMSGRALGHTGGTLDKLESIPGYTTALSPERFRDTISDVGFAMTGQSEDIVPADRKLYALRDVTGTVESVPLITASILSKKFAEGAQKLVFDVKCGSGAFMKELESARRLAESLVETGQGLDRGVYAVITRMEEPLGIMVGNFLEVEESVGLLKGKPTDPRLLDLWEVIMRLVAWMLVAAGKYDSIDEAFEAAPGPIETGEALKLFERNVELQGGDLEELQDRLGSWRAPRTREVTAETGGVVTAVDAYLTGMAGVYLGVGRSTAEDDVLPDVGIEAFKKVGAEVAEGEALCRIYGHDEAALDEAERRLRKAYTVDPGGTPGADSRESMILDEISS